MHANITPTLVRAQFLPPVGQAMVEYLIERETARDPALALMMAAAERAAQADRERHDAEVAAMLAEDVPW